jgi:hypothetical protein
LIVSQYSTTVLTLARPDGSRESADVEIKGIGPYTLHATSETQSKPLSVDSWRTIRETVLSARRMGYWGPILKNGRLIRRGEFEK